MRAILGIIAGITLGSIIAPGTTQEAILALVFVIGILFYIISYIAAKKIALNEIKIEKRKFITNGMFPYMFLLLLFMIMMYTGLHQSLAV
ncbi:MAG: hypothetical protein ACE5SW_11195 [Nitrososphaeraceae archaeon]